MTVAPVRIAVIGAGPAAALIHLPILARLHRTRQLALVHVCDLDEDRADAARRKFGFLTSGGDAISAVARGDVDAVYVFGSARMHHEYGLLALHSGKHLFVEKPIAPSFAEARALADAAATHGLIAVGGHNRRFYKSLDTVRSRTGKAGWRVADVTAHKPAFGKTPPFGARTWLTANGIHALDALVFVMGGLPETMASLAGGGDPPSAFSAVMRWPDGAQGVFLSDNGAGARREEYGFHAPGQSCRIGADGFFIEKDGRTSKAGSFAIMDGFEAEHRAFLSAIGDGTQPRHALAALAPSLFLAEQIERGHQGNLIIPHTPPPRMPSPVTDTVLVIGAATLQGAMTGLPAGCRFVSLSDVRDASEPVHHVRAAIIGRGSAPLTDAVLDKLPNLGAVGVAGLSLAQYRPEDLLRRGITLFNASTAYAETVADFTFALAVLGRRRAFVSHEMMRRGGWGVAFPVTGPEGLLRKSAKSLRPLSRALGLEMTLVKLWRKAAPTINGPGHGLVARDLRGAKVGLVGWGANARAFARRLHASGAQVLVWSQHATADQIENAVPAALEEVLAADIISLHRGLTPATRHFLDAPELAQLRPGAVLINVARGALIEPRALVDRLRRGDVFACLDTFEEEPLDRDSPLRELPNVFLTSHIGGGSPEMHQAAADEVIGKIAAWLRGAAGASIGAAHLSTMT